MTYIVNEEIDVSEYQSLILINVFFDKDTSDEEVTRRLTEVKTELVGGHELSCTKTTIISPRFLS